MVVEVAPISTGGSYEQQMSLDVVATTPTTGNAQLPSRGHEFEVHRDTFRAEGGILVHNDCLLRDGNLQLNSNPSTPIAKPFSSIVGDRFYQAVSPFSRSFDEEYGYRQALSPFSSSFESLFPGLTAQISPQM
jgi:hypothetical protein